MGNELRIDGQVAVVTGGAAGIGKGAAIALARQGAHVVIADNNVEEGERTATEARALGVQALCVPTDVTDTDQIRAMVARAAAQFGRIDVLVNNAGGTRSVPFLEQSERSWRRHADFNFFSMLAATQAAARVMIAGGRGGTIVNVASTEALRAAPGFAVYGALKAGMVAFTRSMALELADHGIRVHALAPDQIITPGLKGFLDSEPPGVVAARYRYNPLGRDGSIDEIGNVVAFLASPMASYLNGVTVPVDGGITASHGWRRAPDGSGHWVAYHE